MARRSTAHAEDDDEARRRRAPRRSSAGASNVEAEEAADLNGDDGDEGGSAKGRKRARIDENGEGLEVKAERVVYKPKPLLRDTDGYVILSMVVNPFPSRCVA